MKTVPDMVAEPVPVVQEWLTATGISITGTSVGTRAQLGELIELQQNRPLQVELTEIALDSINHALVSLDEGTARGRYCIRFSQGSAATDI